MRAAFKATLGHKQVAVLVPTTVLAQQHYLSFKKRFKDYPVTIEVVSRMRKPAEIREVLRRVRDGKVDLLIGTHALIQKHVQLADLGLVVVDEQHRFGVEQRDALRGKAKQAPHVLVMTATPIPRTVAMTVFGDMDTSVLTQLPPGRSPITSHVVANERWYDRAWGRVAEEVAAGHQAYVVCPRIGEDDEADGGPEVDDELAGPPPRGVH